VFISKPDDYLFTKHIVFGVVKVMEMSIDEKYLDLEKNENKTDDDIFVLKKIKNICNKIIQKIMKKNYYESWEELRIDIDFDAPVVLTHV
jgi:hypothetical protein